MRYYNSIYDLVTSFKRPSFQDIPLIEFTHG